MSKIYLKRVGFHLLPTDQESLIALKKLPLDKPLSCEVKQTRNYQFHKKFMALVKIGHENTQMVDDKGMPTNLPFSEYRGEVIVAAGYFDRYMLGDRIKDVPHSIAFGNMSEDKFQEVYRAVLDVICRDIGSTTDEIEQNLINFM